MAANTQSGGQLHAIAQQRDTLNTQLQDANQAYQNVRTELASLRADRERVLIKTTSLEARIDELTASTGIRNAGSKTRNSIVASDRGHPPN